MNKNNNSMGKNERELTAAVIREAIKQNLKAIEECEKRIEEIDKEMEELSCERERVLSRLIPL